MQRRTKGSVAAFDVSSFCVQASWLLMSRPASLSERREALMQPHGGTASPHGSEAANSLSPDRDWRPNWSPLPNGTQRTPDCTVWSKPARLAFPSPGRAKGGEGTCRSGMQRRRRRRKKSSSSTGGGLRCDLSLIVFGSNLLAQLTGNKGSPRPVPRVWTESRFSWGHF